MLGCTYGFSVFAAFIGYCVIAFAGFIIGSLILGVAVFSAFEGVKIARRRWAKLRLPEGETR